MFIMASISVNTFVIVKNSSQKKQVLDSINKTYTDEEKKIKREKIDRILKNSKFELK